MSTPMQLWIEPILHRGSGFRLRAPKRLVTDLRDLCRRARVKMRYTGPLRRVVIYTGRKQIQTWKTDYVGVPVSNLHSRMAALRALEALAYSFFDHGARAGVCRHGVFRSPTVAELQTSPSLTP